MGKLLKNASFILGILFLFNSCGNVALTGSNSGSLIEDRSGGLIMTFVILIVAILAGIVFIFMISKYIANYKNSPEYLEKQKKRPTTISDVNVIAKDANLTKEEKDVLWKITRDKKTPNILFIVKDFDELEVMLKNEFQQLLISENETGKVNLFKLRAKLMKTYKKQIILKNTKSVEVGTTFTFTLTKGFHHKLELIESSPDGMIFTVPDTMAQMNELPEELTKMTLVFETRDGFPYETEARVVRYQTGKDGNKQLITTHTDKVIPLQKRQSERIELQLPCKFSSAKSVAEKNKNDKIRYERAEKEYEGVLEDVSTGGCRLITKLPIKPNQFIYIEGKMNKKVTDSAYGSIVRTTKRNDGMFILHVKFLKIDLAVTNRIQALAIGYDE